MLFGLGFGPIYRGFTALVATRRLKGGTWPGFLLPTMMLGYPAVLLVGFDAWLYNEPLRYAANAVLGATVPLTFHVYFSRVPSGKRGLWFGLGLSCGLMVQRLLLASAAVDPATNGPYPYLGALGTVYALQVALTVALILVLVLVPCYFAPHRGEETPLQPPCRTERPAVDGSAGRIFLAAALVYIMNGLIDIRLFPMVALEPTTALGVAFLATVLVCPMVGRYVDVNPERNFSRLMLVCGWIFMLAPSLAAMGDTPHLFRIVHALTSSGQFTVFICFTLFLAGFSQTPADVQRLPSLLFGWRFIGFICLALARFVFVLPLGATLPAATMAALGFYVVVRRVRPVQTGDEPSPVEDGDSIPSAGDGHPTAILGLDAFLDPRGLSAREREVATLVLREGMGTREMAEALGLSEHTVKTYIKKALIKFGVPSRKALTALYITEQNKHETDSESPALRPSEQATVRTRGKAARQT